MGLLSKTAEMLDRRFGWDRLPRPIGVLALVGLRQSLRRENLHDTGVSDVVAPRGGDTSVRRLDGSYTDLDQPTMGMIGQRFGRNVPVSITSPEPLPGLLEPNPRVVSRELLTRHEFKPATIVNVLAGAWLQFEVHDWFSHGKNEAEEPWELELADDDPWAERPMRIERTRRDPSHPDGGAADVRHRRLALVGRLADLRQRRGVRATRSAPARAAGSGSTRTASSRATSTKRSISPASPATSGSASRSCTRSSRGSTTRSSSTSPASTRNWTTTRSTRRPTRQRGADGEDPHRRVDARDHRAPDDRVRDARELVRDPRQAPRPAQLERGARRHPRLGH